MEEWDKVPSDKVSFMHQLEEGEPRIKENTGALSNRAIQQFGFEEESKLYRVVCHSCYL